MRGVAITAGGDKLVSGGRDEVVNVWSLGGTKGGRLVASIKTKETLEAVGIIASLPSRTDGLSNGKGKTREVSHPTEPAIFTAGESGVVRFWTLEGVQILQTVSHEADHVSIVDAR